MRFRLDLRAISVVEGVRAGLAAALPMAVSVWLHEPGLAFAALAALFTCICDPGGPIRRRLPVLAGFAVGGALLLPAFGLLRGVGIAPTLVCAVPLLFGLSFLQVWGQASQALGNLLAVILLLGADAPMSWAAAERSASVFAAGGAWAVLLTLAIWRIRPYGPAREAVAAVWAALARMTRLATDAVADADSAMWEAQARAGRGAVRAAIEHARTTLMETAVVRGGGSGPAAQNLMRLEVADQVFAALIAIAELLEQEEAGDREAAEGFLRRLRALFAVMAVATERETLVRAPRIERAIAAVAEAEVSARLRPLVRGIADQLRVATRLVDPVQYLPGSGPQGESGIPVWRRLAGPAVANFAWQSVSLRHAARSTAVIVPVLAATLIWHDRYTHWITITMVLVMQPHFASTWQRSLERMAGTLLGGAVTAVLSLLVRTQLHLASLLPVLGALALAIRQVNYSVYIAVYTPVILLLVERIEPGENQLMLTAARTGFTILGGLIAIAANFLLWPSWQPDRVRSDLRAAITAHGAYASAVLCGEGTPPARARRAAGLASNNLEASLTLALREPGGGRSETLQSALVADATLRRIAGRLTAIVLDPDAAKCPPAPALRRWITASLNSVADRTPLTPRPADTPSDSLDRLARQVELLARTLDNTA